MIAWHRAALAWAVVVSLGLGYFVWRIPVQITDALPNLVAVDGVTWWEAAQGAGLFSRPVQRLQIKLVYDLSGGAVTEAFRAVHVIQILLCGLFFVSALRVRDWSIGCAVPVGLAILFGTHTFEGTIREAFPINHFLTVVLCSLLVLNLSLGEHAWWRDLIAVAVYYVAQNTIESGAVVFLCALAVRAAGGRGLSWRAVTLMGVLVLAYFGLRAVYAPPPMLERETGYGLRMLSSGELQARFGAFPAQLYGYNVVSQFLSVLLSEPRNGQWATVAHVLGGELKPGRVIALSTSLAATALIGYYVIARWREWRRRSFNDHDRVVIAFVAVLIGCAGVSVSYVKDVVVSPAGVFHALAATVAVATVLRRLAGASRPTVVVMSALLFLFACGWTIRLVGMHYQMRTAAYYTRNDWADMETLAEKEGLGLADPARRRLAERLFRDALENRAPALRFTVSPWFDKYVY